MAIQAHGRQRGSRIRPSGLFCGSDLIGCSLFPGWFLFQEPRPSIPVAQRTHPLPLSSRAVHPRTSFGGFGLRTRYSSYTHRGAANWRSLSACKSDCSKPFNRTARIALSCLMSVAVITACDDGDIPTPTLEPPATPAREPTATPIRTARPGAAGLDDPLYPGLGNGGYDVSRYTVTLDIDVEANEISGPDSNRSRRTTGPLLIQSGLARLNGYAGYRGWPPSRPLSHRIRADNRARCA